MTQLDLTGKNILVTGGTRGIGRAISLTLARNGARIGAIYRSDAEAARRTLADLTTVNPDCGHFIVQGDISVETDATAAVDFAGEQFDGAIDSLVLDAAVGAGGPMLTMESDAWRRPFDVNVHGAFYTIKRAATMIRRGGSVVFLSSGAGHDYMDGLSAYGASKAAVNHLSGILAQELGPKGIRVNTVSPGHTDKGDVDPNIDPENYSEWQLGIVNTTALRRLGGAQDVANVVLFFVSDLSGFVTGQWVRVNGGRV